MSDLSEAYDALIRNATLFRMSAAFIGLKKCVQSVEDTPFWLGTIRGEFGTTFLKAGPRQHISPAADGLPPGMPKSQVGAVWNPLEQHACRFKLFTDSVNTLLPEHQTLLRQELPKIWTRRVRDSRKWLYYHPSMNKEIAVQVFKIHRDQAASVRRADGLSESLDNVLFCLLHFHGVSPDAWPDRRKGSKRKATTTQSTR